MKKYYKPFIEEEILEFEEIMISSNEEEVETDDSDSEFTD